MQAEINNLYYEKATGSNKFVEVWLNELISPTTASPLYLTIQRIVDPGEDKVISYQVWAELESDKATRVREAIELFDSLCDRYF